MHLYFAFSVVHGQRLPPASHGRVFYFMVIISTYSLVTDFAALGVSFMRGSIC